MAYKKKNYSNRKNNDYDQPKKSGAVYTKLGTRTKTGQKMPEYMAGHYIVNAWNKSSKGLITATVKPYPKTKILKPNSKGNEYVTMLAEVFYHKTGNTIVDPVLMNIETHVIYLDRLSMCITPNGHGKTSSGKVVKGYFGKYKAS